MAEETIFRLAYTGPDVNDGRIGAEDLIEALQGFSRAYERISNYENFHDAHRVKVVGLDLGSTEIVFSILEWAAHNPQQVELVKVFAASAATVIGSLVTLIKIKKHLRKGGNTIQVNGDNNTIVIINSANEQLSVPKRDYEMNEKKLVDNELSNIVRPLEENRIESVELRDENKRPIEGSAIELNERDLFLVSKSSVTTTRDDVWLSGELRSHSKKTDSGLFIQDNGRRIPYKFIGPNPQQFRDEYSYTGQVRVKCRARFDGEMNITRIDVNDVRRVQGSFGHN